MTYRGALDDKILACELELDPIRSRCVNWGHPTQSWFLHSDCTPEEADLAIRLNNEIKDLLRECEEIDGLTDEKYHEDEKNEILELFNAIELDDEDNGITLECSKSALRDALKEFVQSKIKKMY